MTTTFAEQLAGWLELEEELPVASYKAPGQTLVNRTAVRTILGQSIDEYAADVRKLVARLEESTPTGAVIAWGEVAALLLLFEGSGEVGARRCIAAYEEGGGASADADDMALAVATYLGETRVADKARLRRISRDLPSPTKLSAELFFLIDSARGADSAEESSIFSAVRGIEQSASLTVGRTAAPYVCGLGAATKENTFTALSGAMRRYDDLSRPTGGAARRLKPAALEVTPADKVMRMSLEVSGHGRVRCDVINVNELTGELLATFDGLKKNLDASGKKRFDKLRRDAEATLELSLKASAKFDAPQSELNVLARRVAAALELLAPRGYAMRNVVARSESR